MATTGMLRQPSDQDITDDLLVKAARKRILRELDAQGASPSASNSIVNNLYGGGHEGGGMKGVQDLMGGGEDPFDYMVDIERRSLPDDAKGWSKKVHRYKSKKAND